MIINSRRLVAPFRIRLSLMRSPLLKLLIMITISGRLVAPCQVFCNLLSLMKSFLLKLLVVSQTKKKNSKSTYCFTITFLTAIVAGEFNPATNRFQPKYIEKQCHLKQIVKKSTRGANILDLIFTNIREFYESPKILAPIATSDHWQL